MKLIDTHCHLTDPKLSGQLEEVLAQAAAAGVEKVIVPSVSLADGQKVVSLTKNPMVYGLVGIHPENLIENGPEVIKEVSSLADMLKQLKVVGVGEIGLDFYYEPAKESETNQLELLGQQLQLAQEAKLPAVIHMRAAQEEMTSLLNNFSKLPGGQFHCFAGDHDFLELILERGFYVSFCGNITYPNAQNLRQLCLSVPTDRLLLETDSPYLAPQARRGQVNTPANVKITAEFIAQLLDMSLAELAQITTANAHRLYSLKHEINKTPNS